MIQRGGEGFVLRGRDERLYSRCDADVNEVRICSESEGEGDMFEGRGEVPESRQKIDTARTEKRGDAQPAFSMEPYDRRWR